MGNMYKYESVALRFARYVNKVEPSLVVYQGKSVNYDFSVAVSFQIFQLVVE